MKRMIVAANNKPNKTKMRQEFVQLATSIREMSKYEFLELLKNNDFETAQSWIDQLKDLHDTFQAEANSAIQYYVAEVVVDGKSIGYVADIDYLSGSRMWGGSTFVDITSDVDKSKLFSSEKEGYTLLHKKEDLIVRDYDSGVGYKLSRDSKDRAGQLSSSNGIISIYYAGSITFNYIPV